MSAVGLSFGSATSGDGFNVSSTVAEIVSNLQNVEKPWKTELTSLENQDTVISNLGTLYSTLSNDLSSLTDADGVLADKSGSSSDNSVLELSSATSSAVAGTHTVTVTNLAQTSSGYLSEISSDSDTLSGSITLKVGSSGTEQTIDVDNLTTKTLDGVASAINSSGVGITASVLTDSSGSRLSLVSGTSGAGGDITVVSNSIKDGSTSLSYTPSASGKDAQLTVDGVDLTSSSNTVSNMIPGVTFQLLAPSATESDKSLQQIQVVIANDNTTVESTVSTMVSDYNSLVSAMSDQEGTDSSGNSEPLYGSPTLSLLQQQLLNSLNTQNPNGYLDSIKSSSDSLSGSISITVGSGKAQTIDVPTSDDTLSGLASAINSASIGVTANVVTDSSGSRLELVSNTAGSSGSLTVTSSIKDETTSTSLSYTNSGSDINNLVSLGISVNDDGTLSLDTSSLDSVLNSDYKSVVGFFQNSNSWGQSFSNVLTSSGTSSTTGVLKLAQDANSSSESTLNDSISREESRISLEETSLSTELNSANEILQELPSSLNEVNELYSAITGYDKNSGS
jgi:flagellar hook-associated protein 2